MYIKNILFIILVLVCLLQYISFSYGVNIKFFKLRIHLNGYNFYYFNENAIDSSHPNMLMYDHKKRDYCLSFVKYLKNNFKNKTIFLYKYAFTANFSMEEISTLLRVFNYKTIVFFDEILDADIIVFNEKYPVINENFIVGIEKEICDVHLRLYDEKKLESKIVSIVKKIKNNYVKLDEFDLDINNIKKENHIIILGKKDLFDNNNELEYKYSFLNFKCKTN